MPKEFIQEHKIPLFMSISDEDLDLLVEQLEPTSFKAGSVIINEGDPGDCLYLIKEGTVKVMAKLQDTDEDLILSRLESGDYFGEMALITGEPRSASVVAESDTDLWKLSKKDFDNLIEKHHDITLTLTHMLSHRLKEANKARKQVEQFYKERFTPRGNLQETDVISLLKYIEDNSLTGKLELIQENKNASFSFKKGQLVDLDYKNKNEIDAMDEILEWTEGEFVIKPDFFSLESPVEEPPSSDQEEIPETEEMIVEDKSEILEQPQETEAPAEEDEEVDWNPPELFKRYLSEKIEEFNQFAGLQVTKNALRQSYHKFENYFDVLQDIEIDSSPEVQVSIKNEEWSEKHTLFSAILLRDIVTTIERDVIGIKFWTPDSSNPAINEKLRKISFFEYYEQATDFIRV